MTRPIATTLITFLLAACSTVNISLPSITEQPTGTILPGKVVWHDLITHVPEQSQQFYEELFGWEFEPLGIDLGLFRTANYTLIRHQGRLIGGMVDARQLGQRDPERLSQWVVVISVSDIDAAVASVTDQGGKVRRGPVDLNERGRLAVVEDSQGAELAMLQTRDGDPPDAPLSVGSFLWDEVWTEDVDASATFYERAVGFSAARAPGERNVPFRTLHAGGAPRAGVLQMPLPALPSTWVSYVRVEDADTIADKAAELGGAVLIDVRQREVGGEAALLAGPSGAGIAIQTWESDSIAARRSGDGSDPDAATMASD